MKNVIIVRYCEIHLKGKNRKFFEKLLIDSIKRSLKDIEHRLVVMNARYLIEDYREEDYFAICSKLDKICGIHSYSPAKIVKSTLEEISACAVEFCKDKAGQFKVNTNRADKTFPMKSLEVSREIGGVLLDNYYSKLKVNVINPEFSVNIDIRESGDTLIYTDVIKGLGGLPTGASGKGMLMLSGGIDSPVAGFMLAKRGMKLEAVHFHSYPYTSEAALDKVKELASMVADYSGGLKLHVVKFTQIQEAIHKNCPEELMITMMRRFMMRIAERIGQKHGCQAIITGESLGQVASQTIESITSSNSVVTQPVLRPLIEMDKLEIIDISTKIGTFETSILPFEDCCTVFLPKFPAIKPKMETVLKAESKLDVEGLIGEALLSVEEFVY
ncbi:MAG: tRNA 4-thiouridine(8) synthase ThiI [Clostridia bacterium]|nr:tRNA 4-thiouridine(8) synthase ThiI [Clostridia bacterium]